MKNKTLRKLGSFGLVVFGLAVLLTLFGCKECDHECGPICNPQDHAKMQRAAVRVFDNSRRVTIEGYMTDTQWAGVADKIANKLNIAFGAAEIESQNIYKEIFTRGVTYIVEPDPVGYTNCRTTGDGKTIYIALAKVDSSYVIDGVLSIYTNGTTVSKAIQPTHDEGWRKYDNHIASYHLLFKT